MIAGGASLEGASPVLFDGVCGRLASRAGGTTCLQAPSGSVSRTTREERMSKRLWLLFAAAALIGGSAAAQNTGAAALQAAVAKMGVGNMKSIQYSGTGWQG